jgi:hypothetical protein
MQQISLLHINILHHCFANNLLLLSYQAAFIACLFAWEELVEVGYRDIDRELGKVRDVDMPIVRAEQRDIGNRFSHVSSREENDARCARR